MPFQLIGAPWLDDVSSIAAELNKLSIKGVTFDSVSRTIAAGQKHGGLTIPMLRVRVTDRNLVDAPRTGAYILGVIRQKHRKQLVLREEFLAKLAGGRRLQQALDRSFAAVIAQTIGLWRQQSSAFEAASLQDRLYP